MIILLIATVLSLAISFIADRKKTILGLKKSLKMFLNLLPLMFTILIVVSVVLYFTPKETLTILLGKDSGVIGMTVAAIIGSISLIPGFVAFPLGAILIKSGVSYSVITVFITTLMMVGVLTLPLESKYFGWKAAILRNGLSFIGAVIIGITIGLIWNLI